MDFTGVRNKHLTDLKNMGFDTEIIEEIYDNNHQDFELTLNYLLEHSTEEIQRQKRQTVTLDNLEWEKLRTKNPTPRNSHSCCLIGKDLYVFGGQNIFNFPSRTWSTLFTDTSVIGGPSARSHTAICNIGNYLYVFGGEVEGDYNTNDIFCLNLKTLKWNQVKTKGIELPIIGSHSLVVRNDNIYVIGGYDRKTGDRNQNMIKYEFVSEELLNGTEKMSIPEAITYFGSCILHDRLYLFGGWIKGPCGYVYEYDFLSKKWKRLSDMPFGEIYANFAFSSPQRNSIICYGGSNRNTDFNSIYEYQPIQDNFVCLKKDELVNQNAPEISFNPCAMLYENYLFVFSGYGKKCLDSTNMIKVFELVDERFYRLVAGKKAFDISFSFK